MTRQRHGLLAILAFFGLPVIACGGDRESRDAADWRGTVHDSAGVRIVENPATGIWTAETRWTVQKDLSIGVIEGDEDYEFGSVADVDAGADGRIYVLDRQAARIKVYDPDGTYAFSLGRAGEGPGELSTLTTGLSVTPGGTTLVVDSGHLRAMLFGSGGDLIHSFGLDRLPVRWALLPDGSFLEQAFPDGGIGGILVRRDSRGTLADTVASFPFTPFTSERDAEGRMIIDLFPPFPLWDVAADGRIVTGITNRYQIDVRGTDGVVEMIVRKEPQPRAFSDSERGALEERRNPLVRPRAPQTRPAFSRLITDSSGTIWVQGVLPVEEMSAQVLDVSSGGLRGARSSTWEIFSREGVFLGSLTLPPEFSLFRVKGGYVYGVERGELDVQQVVRLRILGP